MNYRPLRTLAFAALAAAFSCGCRSYNPDALWQIVSQSCVPSFDAGRGPGKCARVSPDGYAMLKDMRGQGQYLLIPSARVTGIESPALLQPDAPNYFRMAWENRSLVSQALGTPVPDGLVSLALNSADGRSQNQYHIHIDCLPRVIRGALSAYDATPDGVWQDAVFNGHHYQLMRVAASTAPDPFRLVLRKADAAGQAMRGHTIFMTSAPGGFFVVDGYYQPHGLQANPGAAEELQDHGCRDVPGSAR